MVAKRDACINNKASGLVLIAAVVRIISLICTRFSKDTEIIEEGLDFVEPI